MITMRDFLREFSSVWGGAVAITSMTPLAAWAINFSPPEMPGGPVLPEVICVFGLFLSFGAVNLLCAWKEHDHKFQVIVRLGSGLVGLIVSICTLFCYIIFYDTHVLQVPQQQGKDNVIVKMVVGDTLLPGISAKSNQALVNHYFENTQIWSEESINRNRIILIINYCLFFY